MSVRSSESSGFGDSEPDDMNNDSVLQGSSHRGTKTSSVKGSKSDYSSSSQSTEDSARKALRLKPKKVSPVMKFFCSVRVIVFLVMLIFAVIFCLVVGVTSLVEVRKVFVRMDTLDMKERVQNAVNGFVQGSISVVSRATMLSSDFSYYPFFDNDALANISKTEELLASIIIGESVIVETAGLTQYDNLPFHLVMAWDQDWNERLAFYRPCRGHNNRMACDLPPPTDAFADYEKRNMTLIYKDDIPEFFRNVNKKKPYCAAGGVYNCTGIANIPFEKGGPMIFSMFNVGNYSYVMSKVNISYPFDGWTFLVASNALLFSEIVANRTGLCSSIYSSTENGLSDYMKDQFKTKKEKKLVLNPTDYRMNPVIYSGVINVDSGSVTLEQDYFTESLSKYADKRSDRAICDGYYDHTVLSNGMMETATLVYKTFDFEKGLNDDETVALRFEYHVPISNVRMVYANILVIMLCVIFVVINLLVFLYFNCVFLIPLDHLRKARAELIKNTLAGLEDDGLTKDLFGDIVDDSALIEANGDEITVMLTLQERMDALYASIIKSRIDEVNDARAVTRKELCALRVMNLFMRREDQALRAILPGLMDPEEVVRHYRRANVTIHTPEGKMINRIATAKRAFRSLKAVLGNTIATQFFKAFCIHRGRSSVNSFFFLMDVSWLHQVESGDRNEQDDYLSAMFSDSVAPSPAYSPSSPYLSFPKASYDGTQSSDVLCSTNNSTIDLNQDPDHPHPHRSHFARTKSVSSAGSGETSPGPGSPPLEEEEAKNVGKVPKMPVAKGSSPTMSPVKAADVPQFSSKISDGIAHFIHECYFGRRSLAQRDMRHAALLGCSQVPDYVHLRDKRDIVFSPVMFDNLVTAVTKKFTTEVLPQFHNSLSFQVMVYALAITGFFDDQRQGEASKEEDKESAETTPLLREDDLLKGMWQACFSSEQSKDKKEEDDDSSSSSSDSDGTDDDSDNEQEKKQKDESSDTPEDKDGKPSQPDADEEQKKKKSEPADDDDQKKKSEPVADEEQKKSEPESAKPENGKEGDDDDSSSSSSSDSDSDS